MDKSWTVALVCIILNLVLLIAHSLRSPNRRRYFVASGVIANLVLYGVLFDFYLIQEIGDLASDIGGGLVKDTEDSIVLLVVVGIEFFISMTFVAELCGSKVLRAALIVAAVEYLYLRMNYANIVGTSCWF